MTSDFVLPEPLEITEFQNAVWDHYKARGRSFPWRDIDNGWGVLVSEVMLQQTQTSRVVSYWLRWMEKWPTPQALADASLDEVLREWAGLGYNRRGRFLKLAAEAIVREHKGHVPRTKEEL
ncbi:MAG TPA: A/G-specific adenine glycosylase, partial [Treponema sp.]|nr:A/G-specific adenine glycosylase [Treponema sp.]